MTPRSNHELAHSRIPNEAARHRTEQSQHKPFIKSNSSRTSNYRMNSAPDVSHNRKEANPDRSYRNSEPSDNANVKKEITAGVIVYRKTIEGLKFLLLYHRGQYWNFPKGHVELEEGSLDAAIRETAEETGLKRADLRIIPGFKEYERFYFKKGKDTIFKVVIIYLAETREPRIKISHEHQGYAWFLYREAKQIVGRYKENQKVLERAHQFIIDRHR